MLYHRVDILPFSANNTHKHGKLKKVEGCCTTFLAEQSDWNKQDFGINGAESICKIQVIKKR